MTERRYIGCAGLTGDTVEDSAGLAGIGVTFRLSRVNATYRWKQQFLCQYNDVLTSTDLGWGKCGVVKHRMMTGQFAPIYRPEYCITWAQQAQMDRQVLEVMAREIFVQATSLWGASALLVEKPNGCFRLSRLSRRKCCQVE